MKRRELHENSKTSEEPKKENRDSAISKRESDFDKRDRLLLEPNKKRKVKEKMGSKTRRKPRSKTKRTMTPRTMMRGKKTSLTLRLSLLKTKMMMLMALMMSQISKQLTKKLMINKMLSNLKRMAKKIPESLKILCQLSLKDVDPDQNKMLNSAVNKKQIVVVAVAEERVLKWSTGLKSKLLRMPTLMVKMLKETSMKSAQRIKRRTPKLKLMQWRIKSLRRKIRELMTKSMEMQLTSSRQRMIKEANR